MDRDWVAFGGFAAIGRAFLHCFFAIMTPVEIISKLSKPFALAVRLFGNMTAGHFVILSLFGIIFLFGYLWFYLAAKYAIERPTLAGKVQLEQGEPRETERQHPGDPGELNHTDIKMSAPARSKRRVRRARSRR